MSENPQPVRPRIGLRSSIWGFALVGLLGILVGLGMVTFAYARGTSYLSDDPASCVNCHIMRDQYDAWRHSSHARVATCNDCHTPHGSIIEKYIVKGINGLNHSVAFTLGNFPEPIRIKGFNYDIALENCTYCHGTMVSEVNGPHTGEALECTACHGNVGHKTRDF